MKRTNFEVYETRIDNCFKAAERCQEGSWANIFWMKTAMTLLNRFNIRWER